MTHREVKELFSNLPNLIGYLEEQQVKNFNLFYGLNKNLTILEHESKEIDKTLKQQLPRLFEIEEKAANEGRKKNELIEKANAELLEKEKGQEKKTDPAKPLTMKDALGLLSKKEQEEHANLMKEYETLMEAANPVQLYMLKKENIEGIQVGFWATMVISKFVNE